MADGAHGDHEAPSHLCPTEKAALCQPGQRLAGGHKLSYGGELSAPNNQPLLLRDPSGHGTRVSQGLPQRWQLEALQYSAS